MKVLLYLLHRPHHEEMGLEVTALSLEAASGTFAYCQKRPSGWLC